MELGPVFIPCGDYNEYYNYNFPYSDYTVVNHGNGNWYSDNYINIDYCTGITSYHTGVVNEPYLFINSAVRDSATVYVGTGNECDDRGSFFNSSANCKGHRDAGPKSG
jgi:hypothetical protein